MVNLSCSYILPKICDIFSLKKGLTLSPCSDLVTSILNTMPLLGFQKCHMLHRKDPPVIKSSWMLTSQISHLCPKQPKHSWLGGGIISPSLKKQLLRGLVTFGWMCVLACDAKSASNDGQELGGALLQTQSRCCAIKPVENWNSSALSKAHKSRGLVAGVEARWHSCEQSLHILAQYGPSLYLLQLGPCFRQVRGQRRRLVPPYCCKLF